ncbi:MAG: PKD domain-containing protein, partial [Bacteroidota bacterium]
MKKIFLPFLFLILALPAMTQNLVHISGHITDLANGNPVPYQVVTISNDTAGGWTYNKTLLTNIYGYYIDTVLVPLNSQGILYVRTRDCQSILHQTVLNYSPANLHFTVNFVLCYYPSPCEADFVSVPSFNTVYDFYDQSAGNIIAWHWDFGDPASGSSNTSTSQNATHIFSQTGTYIVCHSVQGVDSACSDTKCTTLVVGSQSPVYLSISGMVTNVNTGIPMANHAVTWSIEDTLYGPRTTYSNSNGFYADSVLLPPGINSGTYYVWTQDCMHIMELWASFSPIHLHLTQDFPISCELIQPCQAKMKVSPAGNLTVQFENKSTGGVSHTFWNFGDGTTSTLENPVHTFSTAQDYLILFSISNNVTGCTSNTVKTISFADSTLFNASFSYSNTQTPKTIQFEDQSSGANGNWYWKFGDGDTSTLENPQHTYRHPGLYMVVLTIGSLDTASWHSCSKAVLVTDSVYPCQSNFTYTLGFQTGPKTVQFTDLSTGTPTEWQWNFGDGDTSTQRYPIHYYTAAGTYHVCLTITGSYCASTFCQDIVVDDSVVYHNVYGQVFAGNFPVAAGRAMIISLDTTGNYDPYVDVCPIDSNGVYYFTLVPEGNYYILAAPSDSSGYVPTYYSNVFRWEQASLLSFG